MYMYTYVYIYIYTCVCIYMFICIFIKLTNCEPFGEQAVAQGRPMLNKLGAWVNPPSPKP